MASLGDRAFPVCNPQWLEGQGIGPQEADLTRLPLIASDTLNPDWLTWQAWAARMNAGPGVMRAADRIRVRFNHYTGSIDAAVNGEGVALGWGALLARHLAEGWLIQAGTRTLLPQERYHLLVPRDREPSPACAVFIDWLKRRFEAEDEASS